MTLQAGDVLKSESGEAFQVKHVLPPEFSYGPQSPTDKVIVVLAPSRTNEADEAPPAG
jgi:hypothetical protein